MAPRSGLLSAALGSLTLLAACSAPPAPPPPPLGVDVIRLEPAPFRQEVATISTLDAVESVQLAAQAGGRIQQLRIRQGDRVRAGDLLVVLDQTQLQAEVMSLRSAQAKDRLNYRRFEYLAQQGAASPIQRDELRQAYISTSASLRARQADLAFRDLRSPLSGVIGDVSVKVGDVIRAGDPFTSVIRNGELNARIDVPARLRNRVRPGQPVILEDPGSNQPLVRGVVASIDPSVNVGSQVLLVKAAYDNRQGSLRNGLRVRTRLVLDSGSQLSVPVGSVSQSSGQSYVWRVGSLRELEAQPGQAPLDRLRQLPPDSRFALQTRVRLGPLQDGRYPVLAGVSEGDVVISSNLLSLRHGLPVKPGAAAAGAAAPAPAGR
ncbi:MAG: efflux RND transporter periplasmic adaptor subunit [Synechococcaceae cyanobacterium]|nr:efflux RND transporter periplasmic adaptor subunit [Synechococcaceae cyanobacterium]